MQRRVFLRRVRAGKPVPGEQAVLGPTAKNLIAQVQALRSFDSPEGFCVITASAADRKGRPFVGFGFAASSGTGDLRGNDEESAKPRQEYAIDGVSKSIDAGLGWLAHHQDADGRWNTDEFMKHDKAGSPSSGAGGALFDLGISSLALLAFLDAGHDFHEIEYGQTMSQALRWILAQQDDKSGLVRFYAKRVYHNSYIYDHALAATVLCKSYAALGGQELKSSAQRAIDFIEQHRNPQSVWRYDPRSKRGDSSVTAWCLLAYLAASDAGLKIDPAAMQLAEKWYLQMSSPVTGRTGYDAQGGMSARLSPPHAAKFPRHRSESMTAVSLFLFQRFGRKFEGNRLLSMQADLLLKNLITDDAAAADFYYWHFASLALYQVGGKHWHDWSKGFKSVILKNQRNDGNFAGSWDPSCVWGGQGGRIYATAITLLTLETSHRFSRGER